MRDTFPNTSRSSLSRLSGRRFMKAMVSFPAGGAEQHDGGLAQAFVDFPGELGIFAPRVGVFFEVDRGEHETANVGRVVTLIY